MAKPKTTVLQTDPLLLSMAKKGRAPSPGSALGRLKVEYPDVPAEDWMFGYGDHKLLVRRKSQCAPFTPEVVAAPGMFGIRLEFTRGVR